MHFESGEIYHVYNRGNNKVRIFFSSENYLFFLRKIGKEWLPFCDIFCYCLMPNHFHFMLQPNEEGCKNIFIKNQPSNIQHLSKAIGKTLSSYTQAINIQNGTTGNLFQKKTKAKCLTETSFHLSGYTAIDYLTNCFWYIHDNPLEARLIEKLKDWPYSSYPDYYGFRNGKLCTMEEAMERIGFTKIDLNPAKDIQIDKKLTDQIW